MSTSEPAVASGPSPTSHRRLVVALSAAALALLALLNWLGSSAVPVTSEQFGKLMEANLVRGITVRPGRIEARLGQRVRVRAEGRDEVTESVQLETEETPTPAEIAGWTAAGLAVEQVDEADQRWRDRGGVALLLLLLGAGVWHLWVQIRQDRTGGGSPRRRLRDLEAELAAGTISQEEFQQRAQAIWAEM